MPLWTLPRAFFHVSMKIQVIYDLDFCFMASLLKGKIRIYPSGLSSVIFSHQAVSSPLVSKEAPDPLAVVPNFGKNQNLDPDNLMPTEKSGHGGLGRKDSASWKSCRNVREIMASVELEYGVKNCGLLTVTLPSIDWSAYESLARYSSYAIDRLNREFKRYFNNLNCEFSRVSVWEYQKRGALHCHILLASECIHAIKNNDIAAHFSKVWFRILTAIGKKSDANMFQSSSGNDWSLEQLLKVRNAKDECVFVNFQKVRKSVVAYLSKYLANSNHEDKKQSKNQLRAQYFPIATWFQWDRKAKALYDKYLDEFVLGECEPDKKPFLEKQITKLIKKLSSLCKKDTEIKTPKNPYNIGFYAIPATNKAKEYSDKIAEFIGSIAHIFREKIHHPKNYYPPTELAHLPYDNVSLDTELTVREYERNHRQNKLLNNVTTAKNFYNLGHLLIELEFSLNHDSSIKSYQQLTLNYES